MTEPADPTVHASAIRVGPQAVLIRGPSGSGKSRLAFNLIMTARAGQIPEAILVGDDRLYLERNGDEVLALPAPRLAGFLEIRGLGIRQLPFVERATVGLIVDLAAHDAGRYPEPSALQTSLLGILIPRIPVAVGFDPLPLVVAHLVTLPAALPDDPCSSDCQKGFGNHIRSTIATE
jgi:HPr kinase/phosphorylase